MTAKLPILRRSFEQTEKLVIRFKRQRENNGQETAAEAEIIVKRPAHQNRQSERRGSWRYGAAKGGAAAATAAGAAGAAGAAAGATKKAKDILVQYKFTAPSAAAAYDENHCFAFEI